MKHLQIQVNMRRKKVMQNERGGGGWKKTFGEMYV